MQPHEIDNCISSMRIFVDSREHPSEEYTKRCDSLGVPYERKHLDYGDYTYSFTLPDGSEAHGGDPVYGAAVIERKMSLTELSGNLCQEHDRFIREMERAKEHNASVYLIVEDGTYEKIINHKYRTNFNEKAYLRRLLGLVTRYGVHVVFIQKELSGRMIREILEKELRTRLERGEYDSDILTEGNTENDNG